MATLAVGAFDVDGAWATDGMTSMTAWMRQHLAMSGGAAAHMVRTARDMRQLPAMSRAWLDGALSSAQIGAVVANVDKYTIGILIDHEDYLVPLLSKLNVRDSALAMQQWKQRADAIAILKRALALAMSADTDFESRPPSPRRADGLIDICRFFLDHQTTHPAGRHRPHVNIVLNYEDFTTGGPGRAIDGTVVDPAWVQTLLCDAGVHRVVLDGRGCILDYGMAKRTAPPGLFNAIAIRDTHCRGPGCDRPPEWCEAHHIPGWEEGGPTSIATMVLLCSRHHHLFHKPGWSTTLRADGTLVITDPFDREWISPVPHPR